MLKFTSDFKIDETEVVVGHKDILQMNKIVLPCGDGTNFNCMLEVELAAVNGLSTLKRDKTIACVSFLFKHTDSHVI